MGVSVVESVANEGEAKTQKINLKVRWVNDDEEDEDEKGKKMEAEEVYFSVNNDMPLIWLMIAYCDKIGVDYDYTCFEFNGARLRETDTPLQLSMLPSDFIHAYRFVYGRCAVNFATICIRMYKEKDTFLRVRRATPLLPQLMRGLSDVRLKEDNSLCFVYQGSRLDYIQTADGLDIQDADIIDAFKFDESCSSLSIISQSLTLKVINVETEEERRITLKRSTRLRQLMNKYCEMEGLKLDNVGFFHGDHELTGSKTVEEEQLNDGDKIDAIILFDDSPI